jgi:hypothetical protein
MARITGLGMMSAFNRLDNIDDPLQALGQCREGVRKLCGDMEGLADQLGGRYLAPAACRSVLKRLRCELPLCHRNEELLYRLLVSRRAGPPSLVRCVDVAIAEHSRAETCSIELAEPLSEAHEGIMNWNPNALGYLMRHCFETIARHLEWEDAAIFADLSSHLTILDERILREGFRRNFLTLMQGEA